MSNRKSKRQLRAEAVERLKNITLDPEGGSHANLDAICRAVYVPSYGWTRGACDGLARTLIGLLTDEPNDELAPESGVSADAAESNDAISEYLGQSRNSGIDARECQPIRDLMEECDELERTVGRLTEENDALREWKACYERACAERDECAEAADAAEKRVKELENELRNMTGARDHWKDTYSIVVGQLGKLRDRVRELEGMLPPLLASDGQPIERGEMLYGLSDGKKWTVRGISHDKKYPVLAECRDAFPIEVEERALKPEWLTHERPMPWSLELALERFGAMFEHETDDIAPLVANTAAEIREKLAKEGGAQ